MEACFVMGGHNFPPRTVIFHYGHGFSGMTAVFKAHTVFRLQKAFVGYV